LCTVATAPVLAHEGDAEALPDAPGWRVGVGVAGDWFGGHNPWPVPRHDGVLLNGAVERDRSGEPSLEHGMLDAAVRVHPNFGVQLAYGWHDQDAPHVEIARVQADGVIAGQRWRWRLGRMPVAMGATIDGAGHFGRFAEAPLALAATVTDSWIDDGSTLAWERPGDASGLRGAELGVWRARKFPGGPAGPAAGSLRLDGGIGHVSAHLFMAHLEPEARGAAALGSGPVGHLHGTPDCRQDTLLNVCFDGRTDVAAASIGGDFADGRWSWAAAALWRRERGSLYAVGGTADYAGDTAGGWVELSRRWSPGITVSGRVERLSLRHELDGVGASAVAEAAGLVDARPVHRVTAAVALDDGVTARWLPRQYGTLGLALEAGVERPDGGPSTTHYGLRLLWRSPDTWKGYF